MSAGDRRPYADLVGNPRYIESPSVDVLSGTRKHDDLYEPVACTFRAECLLGNHPDRKTDDWHSRGRTVIFSETMRDFDWSKSEKKAASAAFNLAQTRETKSIRREAEAMLQDTNDDQAVWRLHDYLSQKRRDIAQKYDYRYSVLIFVFSRLLSEGWLAESDLSGIGEEKMEAIKKMISLR